MARTELKKVLEQAEALAGQCFGLFQYFFQFCPCHEKNLRLIKNKENPP